MSIRPVSFENGIYQVWHDEFNHGGEVPVSEIEFNPTLQGGVDFQIIKLPCPAGCNSISWHPIGGGADPDGVQPMFAQIISERGCSCGLISGPISLRLAQAHVKKHTDAMDGRGRYRDNSLPTGPFEIVVNINTRAIVGIGPFEDSDDFGPDYLIVPIDNEATYELACQLTSKFDLVSMVLEAANK